MTLPIAATSHYAGSADITTVNEAGESGNETASPRASQRRRTSFIEAIANVLIGIGIACLAQIIFFPKQIREAWLQ